MLPRRDWRNSGGFGLLDFLVTIAVLGLLVLAAIQGGYEGRCLVAGAKVLAREADGKGGGTAVAKPVEVDVAGECLKGAVTVGEGAYVPINNPRTGLLQLQWNVTGCDPTLVLQIVDQFKKQNSTRDVSWRVQTGGRGDVIVGIWFDCKPKVNTPANGAMPAGRQGK